MRDYTITCTSGTVVLVWDEAVARGEAERTRVGDCCEMWAQLPQYLLSTIYEQGNGLPKVNDYVRDSDRLYRVAATDGRISTHGPGVGNSIQAELEPVDWDKCSEDDVFPARVEF